jgi:hypothetical protein
MMLEKLEEEGSVLHLELIKKRLASMTNGT